MDSCSVHHVAKVESLVSWYITYHHNHQNVTQLKSMSRKLSHAYLEHETLTDDLETVVLAVFIRTVLPTMVKLG